MQDWKKLTSFVTANECNWSREPTATSSQWGIHLEDTPPHNRLLGPVFSRGGPAGLVKQNNVTVCEWGDIHHPDMTFSVTKTYLALLTGIAVDMGLINNLDAAISDTLTGLSFDHPQNQHITFRHMLQFTSEWSGSCFGIPDQVDHYRVIGLQPEKASIPKGTKRPLHRPGTHWEYNDIRINQFSLVLLHLFERSLPDVFNEHIMQKIGASNTWAWHGYDNSYVDINSQSIQSVPGGGHWGGGMVISPSDQALISQLILQHGQWKGESLISKSWFADMLAPCAIAPFYGFFIWLNTANCISHAASAESYFAMGIGGQLIWHDPARDSVVVFRWLNDNAMEHAIELAADQLDKHQPTS